MNKKQRKELEKLIESMNDYVVQLEEMRDEEQEKFDNLPKSIQDSERGEEWQNAIDSMDQAIDYINDGIAELEEVILM